MRQPLLLLRGRILATRPPCFYALLPLARAFTTLTRLQNLSTPEHPYIPACSNIHCRALHSRTFQLSTNYPNYVHIPAKMVPKATSSFSLDELTSLVKSFGVSEVPQLPNSFPDRNPLDLYRAHITELLAPIVPSVDKKIIYNALQWTQSLDKGDLVIAVPALRIKGSKPKELAEELASKVGIVQTLYANQDKC